MITSDKRSNRPNFTLINSQAHVSVLSSSLWAKGDVDRRLVSRRLCFHPCPFDYLFDCLFVCFFVSRLSKKITQRISTKLRVRMGHRWRKNPVHSGVCSSLLVRLFKMTEWIITETDVYVCVCEILFKNILPFVLQVHFLLSLLYRVCCEIWIWIISESLNTNTTTTNFYQNKVLLHKHIWIYLFFLD